MNRLLIGLVLVLGAPASAWAYDDGYPRHDVYPEEGAPPPPPPQRVRPAPAPVFRPPPSRPAPAPAPVAPPPPPAYEPAPPPPPPHPERGYRGTAQVPPDRVPGRGLCRIWFDGLPPDRQPEQMSCRRAHQMARDFGGRVIWAESGRSYQTGQVLSVDYGAVDFRGVPPDRLPPPGLCRVWLDGVPPDRQPPPVRCQKALHQRKKMGGRILFMPASDLE